MSSSEQEDNQQLNDKSLAAEDNDQQQTQSQATHNVLQEKIKDMISVAHVSRLYLLAIN